MSKINPAEAVKAMEEVTKEKEPRRIRPSDVDVKLRIACVGVGNAGNQLIAKAYKAGFTDYLFAINTSAKDLSDEIVDQNIPSFIAGREGRGAGKNRDKAKQLFKENGNDMFSKEQFLRIINECDAVVVAFALGGGTGSYIGPALCGIFSKMMENSKKYVIAYGVSPKLCDSPQSHYNTLCAVSELQNVNIPILIDDLSELEDLSFDQAYDVVAKNFIEYIRTINGIYSLHSGNGMMDENDMIATTSTPGYQTHYHLSKVTEEMVKDTTLQSRLIDQMKKSPCMNVQKDGRIECMGVITNYPSVMIETSKTGDYSEIQSYIGNRAKKVFENFGEVSTSTASMHIILSGMSLPWDKLKRSEEIVREYEEKKPTETEINIADVLSDLDMDDASSKVRGTEGINKEIAKNVLSDFFNN